MTDLLYILAAIVITACIIAAVYAGGYVFSRGYHQAKREFIKGVINDSVEGEQDGKR